MAAAVSLLLMVPQLIAVETRPREGRAGTETQTSRLQNLAHDSVGRKGFFITSFPSLATSGRLSGQALAHFPARRLRPRGDRTPPTHTYVQASTSFPGAKPPVYHVRGKSRNHGMNGSGRSLEKEPGAAENQAEVLPLAQPPSPMPAVGCCLWLTA